MAEAIKEEPKTKGGARPGAGRPRKSHPSPQELAEKLANERGYIVIAVLQGKRVKIGEELWEFAGWPLIGHHLKVRVKTDKSDWLTQAVSMFGDAHLEQLRFAKRRNDRNGISSVGLRYYRCELLPGEIQ